MVAIFRQGESSGGGRKPKVGARKTENGVELMWNGKGWVKAPNHGKNKPTPSRPINRSHGGPNADWGKLMKTKTRKVKYPTASETRAAEAKRKAEADKNTTPPAPPSGSNTTSSNSSGSNNTSSPTTRRNGFGVRTPVSGGTGHRARPPELRQADEKKKRIADRKAYLQTKAGGGLSKRMATALADKDALKFKG